MLLRTCLTCGDFYADDAPPFCPADGTPLVDVYPNGEAWEEGARVVEEKSRLIQKRTRRLRLRRVLTTMMTVTVTTLIIFVVMANAVIYLNPKTEAPATVASAAKPQQPAPARGTSLPWVPPTTTGTTLLPLPPSDSPTPDESATPDPTRTSTPTPTPDDTSTPDESESPTPTPTTEGPTTVVEPPITPTPTPTPTPTVVVTTQTPPPPPPPATPTPPTCTGDDKRALRAAIAARSSHVWEEAIRREREEIGRAYTQRGAARVGVNLFGPVVYNFNFTKTCAPVSVNAVYVWRVRWEVERVTDGPRPDRPYNGEPRQEPRQQSTGGERKMLRSLTFTCSADGGGGWRCP